MDKNEFGRSFQHYENYYEASKHATNPMAFNYAIVQFFYDNTEPEFTEDVDIFLWKMIRPSIALSRRQSERRQNGGGAHAGNNYNPNGRRGKASDDNQDQEEQRESSPAEDVAHQNEELFPAETADSTPKRREQNSFVPPTKEEVSEYAKSRGFTDPAGFAAHFIAYYSEGEKKWHLSTGKPMKDWKRTVITWEPNNKMRVFTANVPRMPSSSYREERPDYLED